MSNANSVKCRFFFFFPSLGEEENLEDFLWVVFRN